ncbi:hypothetical protein TVAG_163410 [Trichomonas vaginalis G3]|uniref:Uncharacterized protein n=1 Tax=Trichomonas vaginalis (strain ATCC PRA-98 / G3) TaxID=412133 RepID=A2DG18_TRIV3|nr:peptide N-glycanase (PNGase)-related family [Trichomonas vaginalis G3]EAY20645.1 hypothetical protein TVAG_163410 [Trichomonas vaginalis G3]KAI5487366.1 peptide N-glycanase (PNGase)-related family [Trichomonas vaginalis G3]|eukprot:XP_001581631.1 hypothetical protein [Trichomonas vaginalis G3]
MVVIDFYYNWKTVELDINPEIPISALFATLNETFQIQNPIDEIVFLYYGKKIEINDQPFHEAFGELESVNEVHIGFKNEIAIIDEFCVKNIPSLKYEAIMMDARLVTFLRNLNGLHKIITKIYESQINFDDLVPKELIVEDDVGTLQNLAKWFTGSIMTWIDAPVCNYCKTKMMFSDYCSPSASDKERGADASRKYKCRQCKSAKRIPIFFNTEDILNIRKGMSAEYCILFGAILRKFGFECRIARDIFINYLWLEVYSYKIGRFIHVDPVAGIVNLPFIYEVGNKLNISRVISVGMHELFDVTSRYVVNIDNIAYVRKADAREEYYQQAIGMRNIMWSYGLPQEMVQELEARKNKEYEDLVPQERKPSPEEKVRISRIDTELAKNKI